MRSMEAFAPDPDVPPLSDQQLEQRRQEAVEKSGGGRGIELKGDGKGAGSGEEVR